jgi:hypothetical protein
LNGTWTDNFGLGGEYYGPNIPLVLEEARLTDRSGIDKHWCHDGVPSAGYANYGKPGRDAGNRGRRVCERRDKDASGR